MTIATFALGIVFVLAGAGALLASLGLLPTELGLLYLACGVILLSGGAVTLAIGVVVRRLDVVTRLLRASQLGEHASEFVSALAGAPHEDAASEHEPTEPLIDAAEAAMANEGATAPPLHGETHALDDAASSLEAPAVAIDEPAHELIDNIAVGRPAAVAEIELAAPEGPPTLVGHYSAGGANYKIFSDGSIEAEMETGAFRFASMDDFKAYLAGERA